MPRDKTANHIKLMAAASEEFLEYGFEKASMRSIGERCSRKNTAAGELPAAVFFVRLQNRR